MTIKAESHLLDMAIDLGYERDPLFFIDRKSGLLELRAKLARLRADAAFGRTCREILTVDVHGDARVGALIREAWHKEQGNAD